MISDPADRELDRIERWALSIDRDCRDAVKSHLNDVTIWDTNLEPWEGDKADLKSAINRFVSDLSTVQLLALCRGLDISYMGYETWSDPETWREV